MSRQQAQDLAAEFAAVAVEADTGREGARADAAYCADLVRRNAKTFFFASRFLPAAKRRAAFAVYAFCRLADDVVDAPPEVSPSVLRRAIDLRRAFLEAALNGVPRDAVHRELAVAIAHYGVPAPPFHALLDMLERDIAAPTYETWPALYDYCAGVASTVGVICAHIFGLPDRAEDRAAALSHARVLGVAMQLTNILRDVGEDASRGRCYLPTSDLDVYGIDRQEILAGRLSATDDRWRALMEGASVRARGLYVEAAPGIALLDADARSCATLCATGYAAILDELERIGYDSLRRRAHVGFARKIVLACRAVATTRRPARGGQLVIEGTA